MTRLIPSDVVARPELRIFVFVSDVTDVRHSVTAMLMHACV